VPFVIALQFLTTLPVKLREEIRPGQFANSLVTFPIVGALIGLFLYGMYLLSDLLFNGPISAGIVLVMLLLVTGALHLDGLMDTCDGLLCSGKSLDERLKILKDSRVGSFGVVGGLSIMLLKLLAIMALPQELRLAGLVLMPTLGRWAQVYAIVSHPYARSGGLGDLFRAQVKWRHFISATAIALAIVVGLAEFRGLMAMAIALLAAWLVARFAVSRIAGLTGDVYGAINEVVEVAVLLALPVLPRL